MYTQNVNGWYIYSTRSMHTSVENYAHDNVGFDGNDVATDDEGKC